MASKKMDWKKGLRFQCQGSGNCCLSRGEYGFVYLTTTDRKRMARHLNLGLTEFTRKYCKKTHGYYHLKENTDQLACMFLEANRCQVYAARPTQCRTWPFWPELMNAKKWNLEVKGFCPGVNKGSRVSAKEIQRCLDEQAAADAE